MWGLSGGGGGVLKGMPLLKCRGDSKAGPSLSCEEGEWAVGTLGAGPLAAGWNSSLAAWGWPVTGLGLRD